MKPNIKKAKDIRGRRITHYVASIGPLKANGPTAQDASASVEKDVLAALTRLDQGTRFRQWRGHTIAVSPTLDGWSYWIDTFTNGYAAHMGAESCEHVFDSALSHLFQNVWDHESNDREMLLSIPPSLREEIARWIGFQRAHKRLTDAGADSNAAHRGACEKPDVIDYIENVVQA